MLNPTHETLRLAIDPDNPLLLHIHCHPLLGEADIFDHPATPKWGRPWQGRTVTSLRLYRSAVVASYWRMEIQVAPTESAPRRDMPVPILRLWRPGTIKHEF